MALLLLLLEQISSFQTNVLPLGQRISQIYYSDQHAPSSFADRMRKFVTTTAGSESTITKSKKKLHKEHSPLIDEVTSLSEFRQVVIEEAQGSMVVVRFYAPWCRACRAMEPGFYSMAKKYAPEIKFVDVSVGDDNINLHQGLGVPSIPYVHLYHPDGGLVEEQRFARKNVSSFSRLLRDYQDNLCSLERGNDWSTDNPYRNDKEGE
jgi:thiol-disulfide isomerase/thioredoxin